MLKTRKVTLTIIFIVTYFHGSYSFTTPNRDSDICGHWNGRRHFLEMGDRGELHAKNLTNSYARNYMYTNIKNNTVLWYQCNLELVTCAECVIRITFTYTNFSKRCDRYNKNIDTIGGSNHLPPSRCPCDHIEFSEPPYDTDVSGQYFCGDGKVLRSQTRSLLLKFFYKESQTHIFSLQYFSERNVKIVSGSPQQSKVNNSTQIAPNIVTSPYFPLPYPRDYGVEHIFSCDSENCHVRLDFTDFQIGLSSTMEIFDSNGQMIDTYMGDNFRPPIIVSTGKSLLLQFRGNGVTGIGYRAEITFIPEKQLADSSLIPITDCGGMVTSYGGAITMMNMIENTTNIRYYDCIWIIKPGNNYMLMKTHIMLRVDTFHGMASRSELTIRQGTISIGDELESIRWPGSRLSKKNHVIPIMAGFYVRLKGVFGLPSRLAIVYSLFNYLNCYIGSEFLCENNHCISVRLHCDGFDHCGDGSDEPEKCEEDWAHSPNDRRWYSHKPNYYFPKIDQYPDLRTATGIFVISTLGILLVISGWMVILYRMGVRARNQRELQNHLQTISELLDRQDELPIDEPPVYEAPPDYEEVIKVGMDDQIRHCRRMNCRRHRETRPHRSRTASNAIVPSVIDPNMPSCSNAIASCSSQLPEAQMDDMANRVLVTTAYCEVAETTPAAAKRFAWKDKGCQTSTILDYTSPAYGAESSNCNHSQENLSYSLASPTQYEERSAEFRDESLNVSLTLSIPGSNLSENNPLRPKTTRSTVENSCFRKTWRMFSNGGEENLQNNVRGQSTQSTPSEVYQQRQDMNYGSYLQSDRNSFMSTTSTFGSDLPMDRSPDAVVDLEQRNFPRNNRNLSRPGTLYHSMERLEVVDHHNNESCSGDESDCNDNRSNVDVSCFGQVNLFGAVKQKQQRQHVRSKSFNQNDCRRTDVRVPRLKRCSSADLLLLIPKW